jgi:hypothetical protein
VANQVGPQTLSDLPASFNRRSLVTDSFDRSDFSSSRNQASIFNQIVDMTLIVERSTVGQQLGSCLFNGLTLVSLAFFKHATQFCRVYGVFRSPS